MKTKLLIIEDDSALAEQMRDFLADRYEVHVARSIAGARAELAEVTPDIAVLDLILPDGNGMELLKSRELSCPVVILTTIIDDDDQIDGLDSGAKDYLIKPVSMRVLEKRLQVRLAPRGGGIMTSGKLTINTAKRTVEYAGNPVALTSTEFNILVYLYEHAEKFHTAESIYGEVYGDMFLQSTTIKMHLSKLRYKLKQCAPNDNFIVTAYGKGYRFIREADV